MGLRGRTLYSVGRAAAVALVALTPGAALAQAPAVGTSSLQPSTSLPLTNPDTTTLSAAKAEVRSLEATLAQAREAESSARAQAADLEQRLTGLTAQFNQLGAQEREAARNLAQTRAQVRGLAVHSYVNGGPGGTINELLDARSADDLARRRQLVQSADRFRVAASKGYAAAQQAASTALRTVVDDLDVARRSSGAAMAEADFQGRRAVDLAARLDQRRKDLDLLAAVVPVPGSDIPRLFVDAYRRAASTMAKENPACGIRWSAVAAIGKVESNHGRAGNTRLAPSGLVAPAIIGLKLDGTAGTAFIPDTDGGRLDGDPTMDRAVGPMQFIPSTWVSVGQDGNGDGQADPNNAYDAALSTAVYLCRASTLTDDAGMTKAFLSYNHSDAYAAQVLSWARTYDALGWDPPKAIPAP